MFPRLNASPVDKNLHGTLSEVEMTGLAALFNSVLIDRYFRAINGHTQVNASEIRTFPLPSLDIIQHIGEDVLRLKPGAYGNFEAVILDRLHRRSCKAIFVGKSRMKKIEEALHILEALGMPRQQQNERSALTLLALAGLQELSAWTTVSTPLLRTVDMMEWMKHEYDKTYAPNSRETIRRQTIHQFEQARIVDRNPDDVTRPTNSGNF